jgi:hypothetical protein
MDRKSNPMWMPLRWCLPCLLGFAAFLLSFPINRVIPFWPHLSLDALYALWFIFVTPITTAIAIIIHLKRRKTERFTALSKKLVWAAIAASLVANSFVLFGMWAAYTY